MSIPTLLLIERSGVRQDAPSARQADGSGQTDPLGAGGGTRLFAFAHLPGPLQKVSAPFRDLAVALLDLPRNPERTVALRKLLESKDAAVRAALAK